MAQYGGLGGVWGGRSLNERDAFEMAIFKTLGEHIKNDDKVGQELWSALANQKWKNKNGDTAWYSFRAAGDLIAAVKGKGDYMDWYCSGPYATVSPRIATAMAEEGWFPVEEDE